MHKKIKSILKRIRKDNSIEPNCMIVVESTKKRISRYVPPKYIPRESFERDYEGSLVHILGLDLGGNFWSINVPPEIKENESPTDLFMAKHCAEEVEEVYGLSLPMREKIKIGILVFLCFAILIVIFLMVSTSTGGRVA